MRSSGSCRRSWRPDAPRPQPCAPCQLQCLVTDFQARRQEAPPRRDLEDSHAPRAPDRGVGAPGRRRLTCSTTGGRRPDEGPFSGRLTERPHPGRSQSFRLLRNNAAHNRRAGVAAGVLPWGRGRRRQPDSPMVSRQTSPRGHTAGRRREQRCTGSASVEQVGGGGGRGAGTSVGRPRWVRISLMTTGSSMVAIRGRRSAAPR
jgi:hypothetical protein